MSHCFSAVVRLYLIDKNNRTIQISQCGGGGLVTREPDAVEVGQDYHLHIHIDKSEDICKIRVLSIVEGDRCDVKYEILEQLKPFEE